MIVYMYVYIYTHTHCSCTGPGSLLNPRVEVIVPALPDLLRGPIQMYNTKV
jgi:hypothetical protein